MRTEEELMKEIKEAGEKYHEVAQVLPVPQLQKMTADIKVLKKELSDLITDGANACPNCKNAPHGMKKNPTTYEVGCVVCNPYEELRIDENKIGRKVQVSYSSRGATPALAVENWNKKVFVTKYI